MFEKIITVAGLLLKFRRSNPPEEKYILSRRYKNKVETPLMEEAHFFKKTGIRTNHVEIPRWIRFKDKLGAFYTWEFLKHVQTYVKYDRDDLYISLTKMEIRRIAFSQNAIISMVVGGGLLSMFFCLYFSGADSLLGYIMMVFFLGFSTLFLHSMRSLYYSAAVERRLAQVETKAQYDEARQLVKLTY